MPRPDLQKTPTHLHEEINLVKHDEVKEAFGEVPASLDFFRRIPDKDWGHSYAPGKWTIKGVVQHIIDGERIFCNRALVIARGDKTTPLPSFDEKEYGANSKADNRSKDELLTELEAVQVSSRLLFSSFDDEQLDAAGTVNNYTIDVNTLGFVIIGHTLHHMKVVRERYL